MSEIIIKPDATLFHGTMEKYDVKNVRPGGYDSIFWTTDSSTIAQTYIPISGVSTSSTSELLRAPNGEFNHQLGLNFADVEVSGNRVTSYRDLNPYFNEIDEKKNELIQELIKWEKTYKELGKQIKILSEKMMDTRTRKKDSPEWIELGDKYDDAYDNYKDTELKYQQLDSNSLKNEFINKKMTEMGHKPSDTGYQNNHRWDIKIGKDESGRPIILPPDFKESGRLFVINPKRDMKIYDISTGESDLTDLQYHNHELFERLEKEGYDGVKIDDFAQHDKYGNVGHTSIGFFKSTINDLDIKTIDNVQHPDELRHHSDEYTKSLNEATEFFNFLDKFNTQDKALIEAIKEGYSLLESLQHPKVEYVDTDVMYEFREFDRIDDSMYSSDAFENFKRSIQEEGIKEELLLIYHQYSKTAYLGEGNHRLRAARELGIDKVPVRVVRYQSEGKGIKVPGYQSNEHGYVPGDLSPSEIGIQ
jgi:hypothetical protein